MLWLSSRTREFVIIKPLQYYSLSTSMDVDNIHLGWYVSRSSLKEETVLLVQVVVFQDKKRDCCSKGGLM